MTARISDAVSQVQRVRVDPSGHTCANSDWLAREEPLEIRVRGQAVAVTMRTPGEDAELAVGFLVSEGLIQKRDDVTGVAHCQTGEHAHLANVINVFLAPGVEFDFQQLSRHVFASSSCGLCGKASIESVHQHFPPVQNDLRVSASLLQQLPGRLSSAQEAFAQTGGIHAAALFAAGGELLTVHEDVGRHNAVDKLIGRTLLHRCFPLEDHILLVSGRTSFEIMQKALAARIPIVAAISAPSSLAAQFAHESGQTLVGFLRGESFNIYAHAHRIT